MYPRRGSRPILAVRIRRLASAVHLVRLRDYLIARALAFFFWNYEQSKAKPTPELSRSPQPAIRILVCIRVPMMWQQYLSKPCRPSAFSRSTNRYQELESLGFSVQDRLVPGPLK